MKFGTTSGTKIKVLSETKLTMTSPAHAAGRVDVRVTAGGGTTPIISLDRFTYRLPAITSISPSKGPLSGGSNVTIAGTDLVGVSKVTVGGESETLLPEPFFGTLGSPDTLSVRVDPHAPGPVPITAIGGKGTATFTYR